MSMLSIRNFGNTILHLCVLRSNTTSLIHSFQKYLERKLFTMRTETVCLVPNIRKFGILKSS